MNNRGKNQDCALQIFLANSKGEFCENFETFNFNFSKQTGKKFPEIFATKGKQFFVSIMTKGKQRRFELNEMRI